MSRTLEVLELPELDVPIACDAEFGCDNAAEFAVHTKCCVRLYCEHCVTEFTMLVSSIIELGWAGIHCGVHDIDVHGIYKISDFILSVERL